MRSSLPLLLPLFLLSSLPFNAAHSVILQNDSIVDGEIVSSKITYVPLGFDYAFPCEAVSIVERTIGPQKVYWRRHDKYSNNTAIEAFNTTTTQSTSGISHFVDRTDARVFYSTETHELYLLGVQRGHNKTVFECVVTQEDSIQNGANSSDSNGVKFVSRHTLMVQDCGVNDHELAVNDLNPCAYGSCQITNDSIGSKGVKNASFERLQCVCVEQFSGEYCERQLEWAIYLEVLFYGPIIAHPVTFFLFLIYLCCCRKKKIKVTAISDLLISKRRKEHNDSIMKILYPAAFYEKAKADIEVSARGPGRSLQLDTTQTSNHSMVTPGAPAPAPAV